MPGTRAPIDNRGTHFAAAAPGPASGAWLLRQKRERLQRCNLEGFTAADIGAAQLVVAAHHIRLGLGEAGAIAFIGAAGQLLAFAAHYPGHFVLAGLPAFGAGKGVCSQFRRLVEEFPFIHGVKPRCRPRTADLVPRALWLESPLRPI